MPTDLQIEYLNKLQDKYDINLKHINTYLFGLQSPDVLRSHCKLRGILNQVGIDKKRGKTGLQQFKDDIAEARRVASFAIEPATTTESATNSELPLFMEYQEFIDLSGDEKVQFVERLLVKYDGIGIATIEKALWGKCVGTLKNILSRKNLIDKINHRRQNMGGRNIGKYKIAYPLFIKDIDEWRKSKSEVVIDSPNTYICIENAAITSEQVCDVPRSQVDEHVISTIYHNSAYTSSYVSLDGLDVNELGMLVALFENKKVSVSIDIRVMS